MQNLIQISRSQEFHFGDSRDIPALCCKWVTFKMADDMFKLNTDPNLGVVDFCCKSLPLVVALWHPCACIW